MSDLEQQFAEYLGNSFVPFPGWEERTSGGGQSELAKYSSELRARAKGHTLRRIKYDLALAKKACVKAPEKPVEPVEPVDPVPALQMAKMAHWVCRVTEVPLVHLRSSRRQAEIVRARHMFFYLCREFTPHSFPAIGVWCGNRDHTTVMYGAQKVADNLAQYPELEKIKSLLGVDGNLMVSG